MENKFDSITKQIQTLIDSKLPRMIGKYAVDHFRENFILGGFVDNGLNKWQTPKRFDANSRYAGAKYLALLSARNELYNSITYTTQNGAIYISSDKEYAQIHNEGGETHPTVTDKMRGFAWHKHKETGQKNSMWKSIALTKKTKLDVKIPKRQFVGESAELNLKIQKLIELELAKILR
jgi:phage gpG-like protein